MKQFKKNLGKVSLTPEGIWDSNKEYEILSIVCDEHTQHGFISKKEVPPGVDLYNSEYWMPLNVSGFADNNMIILSKKTSDASIQSYTLEEAVKSIPSVGRRPGTILGFYNLNTDRLDIGGRWELWQYNAVDNSNWENVECWQSLYYNYNKFVGWYRSEELLKANNPFPEIGCYAFVGTQLNEATIYRCDRKYVWEDTAQHAWDYVKVIVDGNVTVGENGNWFNNGVDTNIPASIKGENGKTPLFRNNNNVIEVSYDNVEWNPISDEIAAWFRWQSEGGQQVNSVGKIQITRNGVTWTDLSGQFVNNLRISRYIGVDESLPTSGIVEGTIYAKGPTYSDEDINHANPIYRLWVYAWKGNTLAWVDNGKVQSIVAGVTQETGDSETEVMSQKAVTTKLSELGSEVEQIKNKYEEAATDEEERIVIENENGETIVEVSNEGFSSKNVYAVVNGRKKNLDTEKQDKLIYDEVPTLDSHNAVDSNAVAVAIAENSNKKEETEDNSEFVLLEDKRGNPIAKVGEEGLSIGKSIRKYLQGKYRRGEYISSGGEFKTASSLSMFEYDVTGISSVVVESVISSSTGIPLWNGYKDGVRVGKGTVYSSGNELRKEIVDTTEYDVLYVNAQILGGACVYVEEYGLTEVGSYKSNNVGLFLGDSLMQGVGAPLGFDAVSYAEKILGCKTFNGGIGGTTMKDDGRGANLYKVVESLLSGDWADVDAFISRIVASNNSAVWKDVPVRYSEIKNLKMQDISFVFICYGANDWKSGATLDNEDNKEDVTTVCGSLRYAVRRLTEMSPSIQIFVATPGYRSAEEETPEINGVTLRAFCHAVEDACKELHIPCWNQYLNNGLNKHNASLYLNDGTHRNAQGYALLGSQYANFINNNLNRIIL